jgi:hypothetical protein
MKHKIELPKERLPFSTRGTQIHKGLKDYDRNLEKEQLEKAVKESSESE